MLVIACALPLAGCASRSAPLAVPASAGRAHPVGARVVAEAQRFLGVAYRAGGVRPDGFDCSGFVQYLYTRQGVSLPRTAHDQFGAGERVAPRRLLPGDLVFFRTQGRRVSHVGVSLGDDRFVHAPNVGSHVRIDRLNAPYWSRRFAGVRRVTP